MVGNQARDSDAAAAAAAVTSSHSRSPLSHTDGFFPLPSSTTRAKSLHQPPPEPAFPSTATAPATSSSSLRDDNDAAKAKAKANAFQVHASPLKEHTAGRLDQSHTVAASSPASCQFPQSLLPLPGTHPEPLQTSQSTLAASVGTIWSDVSQQQPLNTALPDAAHLRRRNVQALHGSDHDTQTAHTRHSSAAETELKRTRRRSSSAGSPSSTSSSSSPPSPSSSPSSPVLGQQPPPHMLFSSNRNAYLPVPGSGPPSTRTVKGTFRRLKSLLFVVVFLFIVLQAAIFFPALVGEERAQQWGWKHPSQWIGGSPGPWDHPPPGPPPPGPPPGPPPAFNMPAHGGPPNVPDRPLHHLPPSVIDTTHPETPYTLAWDTQRISSDAFPPPWGAHRTYDAATSYASGNPHVGIIPPLQLDILKSVPPSRRPPRPAAAPVINSTVWNRPVWTRALNGSKTTFADSFKAHLQETAPDHRLPPFNDWTPPLEHLDTSRPPTDPVSFSVQWLFEDPSKRSGRPNDAKREEVLRERQQLVKNAFLHSWEGYKRIAWGHDELTPISERANDPFNGWGATIVDALDTLLVMDLPDEYDLAREHVRDIDFWFLGGERSAYGRNDGRVPVFETAIRYLGGFLSAYDLSGDEMMRDRAEELAQLIMPAFFTRSGVPLGRVRFGSVPVPDVGGSVLLAEAGSLLLEFTRLWQVTGNRTYFDRVQRTTDWLDRNMTESAKLGSLLPTHIVPDSGAGFGSYSFGAMADSYFEYLIKGHQLLGGRLSQYGRMYSDAIDSARKYLIKEVKSVPNLPLLVFGSATKHGWEAKMEHLACFTGGMLGLGARLMPGRRKQDFDMAQRMTETCWWSYNSSATGIGPEETYFFKSDDPNRFEIAVDADGTQHRGQGRGWPIVGVSRQMLDYRGRPETIESVFYMWRLTGDSVWQERGWQMFASWATHAMTKVGFANVHDVQSLPATLSDNMESFVFAETFKYYYLLFSPPNLISLNDYVFTTEAHPLLVPQNGRWTDAGKGPRKFWNGPRPKSASQEYSGGEDNADVGGLTNVQKQYVYRAWQQRVERERLAAVKAQADAKVAEVVQRAKLAGSEAVEILVARVKDWLGSTDRQGSGASAGQGQAESSTLDQDEQGERAQVNRVVDVELTEEIALALENLKTSGAVQMDGGGDGSGLPRSAIIQTSDGPLEVRFTSSSDDASSGTHRGGDEAADEHAHAGCEAVGHEGEDDEDGFCPANLADYASDDAIDTSSDSEPVPRAAIASLPVEVADDKDLEQMQQASIQALRRALKQLRGQHEPETSAGAVSVEDQPQAFGAGFGARMQRRS
ncbi:unnamed protein product [Parajaminaea phylloscopi]